MKLGYKSKKWILELCKLKKFKKTVGGKLNNDELVVINQFLDKNSCAYKEYLRLYSSLYINYMVMAKNYYLDHLNNEEVVKYTYLSGYSMIIAKCLYIKGVRAKMSFINRIVEKSIKNIDIGLFELIATEQVENQYIEIEKENLVMLMYYRKYEQAKEILEELPDNVDESKEIYYERPEHLKHIYMAIIEHDEKKFNEELAKRIKKYRRNMVGYSTIVDVVSIALIKMAQKEGIQCTIDVIEIPKQFFDESSISKLKEAKLPFYDEFLESGLI